MIFFIGPDRPDACQYEYKSGIHCCALVCLIIYLYAIILLNYMSIINQNITDIDNMIK